MRLIKILPMLLLLSSIGCVAGRNPLTIERPNARTSLEERAYNLMLTSEKLITTAEKCEASETCEVASFMVPVINALIDAHNLAREASLVYVAFLDIGESATADSERNLEDLIFSLDTLITRIVSGGGSR